MLRILHISDLHFGPFYLPRVGDVLLATTAELKPHIVVISGDFTQRAKITEFEGAHDYMQRIAACAQLPGGVVAVAGNHDVPLYRVWERLFAPFANYQKYISPALDAVHRFDVEISGFDAYSEKSSLENPHSSPSKLSAVIVALNSAAPHRAISNGRIRRTSLEVCQQAFTAQETPPLEKALRIVVAHHHFAPAPDYEGGEVMPKAKRAMDLFANLKVDMILGGHLHRAYIGNSLDVYPGEERDRGIIIVQAGTATSRRGRAREREKNSFNVIETDGQMVWITHWMYFEQTGGAAGGAGGAFAPASRHVFPRPGMRFRL